MKLKLRKPQLGFMVPALMLALLALTPSAFAMGERKPVEAPVITIGDRPTLTNQAGCVVGGCSGQLCLESGPASEVATTCEWREAYACYHTARCERQASGRCGWTETPALTTCLSNAQ